MNDEQLYTLPSETILGTDPRVCARCDADIDTTKIKGGLCHECQRRIYEWTAVGLAHTPTKWKDQIFVRRPLLKKILGISASDSAIVTYERHGMPVVYPPLNGASRRYPIYPLEACRDWYENNSECIQRTSDYQQRMKKRNGKKPVAKRRMEILETQIGILLKRYGEIEDKVNEIYDHITRHDCATNYACAEK